MTADFLPAFRPGYLIEEEGDVSVAVYCSGCTNFVVKGFGDEAELQAFKDGKPFRRASNCPYSLDCPSNCREYEAIYAGDAMPGMVEWLKSGRADWPKCPEDFIDKGNA